MYFGANDKMAIYFGENVKIVLIFIIFLIGKVRFLSKLCKCSFSKCDFACMDVKMDVNRVFLPPLLCRQVVQLK